VAGTDMIAGLPLVRELELYVEAGMTPAEALRAATAGGAAALHRDDVGVIAPGRRADLVVLDIGLKVREVYRAGQRLPA
jgi:imidazolonepropionase